MIKTALLVLGISFLCAAVMCLQAILLACWMTLDLQEWVVVCNTPIVVRMTFGKCRCE